MRKNTLVQLLLSVSLFTIISCRDNKTEPQPDPAKAELIFPNQNSACTSGMVISSTESTVPFSWAASANTETYELHIKNILTDVSTTQTTTGNQVNVTLLRNTPYSWHVISKSSKTTAVTKSDSWKFYNSGLAVVSHSPFPADIVAPAFAHSITAGTTTIKWLGSDADNDIAGYDVYFGSTTTPALLKSDVTDMFLNVTATAGSTYYWRVITKDAKGNNSTSELFQFKAN